MNNKVLCIGSAVVDIAASPINQDHIWKEKQKIRDISLHVGGDAVNQSLMLSLLGENSFLSASVGPDENGFYMRSILEKRGVQTCFIKEKPEYQTGTALVIVDDQGERHIFSVIGAYSFHDRSDAPDLSDPKFSDLNALSIASLFDMKLFEEKGMTEYLKEAKERNILTFADLASDKEKKGLDGIKEFLPYLDYFLPSIYDAVEMTGKNTPEEAAQVYLDLGAGAVIIKCGADGCYYRNADISGYAPAIPVKTVDTTGAGDAMVAMFIHEILSGRTISEACHRACTGASYTTTFTGASSELITKEDLEAWIRRYSTD